MTDPVSLGLTRDELLDVALLDVLADAGVLPVETVVEETRDFCSDHEAWSPDVWPLLEMVPTVSELHERLRFLGRLGMVRRTQDLVEITRAGYQMWDGFPWEYAAEEDEEDE